MRILCDRCRKEATDFEKRKEWKHIESSEQLYGKLGDYYLCPSCAEAFLDFLENCD